MEINEQRIIRRVLEGDTQAFAPLVHQYQNVVFSICLKLIKDRNDAEEVAQQSFVKAYTALSSFKTNASFSTWLYRIAYNASLDWLKAKKRRFDHTWIEPGSEPHTDLSADGALLDEEQRSMLAKAIDKLDERSQLVILLYYYEDKSVKEIAKVLDLSESNVKVVLLRARRQLHKDISKKNKREDYGTTRYV